MKWTDILLNQKRPV